VNSKSFTSFEKDNPLANCELVCVIDTTDIDKTRIAKIPRFRCLNTLQSIRDNQFFLH